MKLFLFQAGAGILALAAAAQADKTDYPSAQALLKDKEGKEVGRVEIRETPSDAVWISATGSGLPPGWHGFHIHEIGNCSNGFKSAGGHLEGDGTHGILEEYGPHAGDLPNLHVHKNGEFAFETFVYRVSVESGWFEDSGMFDADGVSVVIHADADDYKSQPSGQSGDRIACGVIEKQ